MLIAGCVSAAEPRSGVTSSSWLSLGQVWQEVKVSLWSQMQLQGCPGSCQCPLDQDPAPGGCWGPSPRFRGGDEKLHPLAVPLPRNAHLQRNLLEFGVWHFMWEGVKPLESAPPSQGVRSHPAGSLGSHITLWISQAQGALEQ